MITRLKKFIALNARHQWIFVQAWFLLGWCRAGILLRSFKRLTVHLQHHASPPLATRLSDVQQREARAIGRLVAAAAKYTPWKSPCLAQVLVVQRLLARCDIPGQFYLGVRRGCEATDDPTSLSAHAWVRCGEDIVNGGPIHDQFTVLSAYSWGAVGATPGSAAPA